ncbi:MAG: glycosyltransferase family 39 protein [Actinomycetota bacterium]
MLTSLRAQLSAPASGGGASSPARDQSLAAAGQLAAGVGNLLFAFALVRLLSPDDYSHFAAFAALYLIVHVLTGSLSAGSAQSPSIVTELRPRLWKIGLATSLILVAASEPIGALIGLPGGLVLALALSAPAASLLAVERGRLYGVGAYRHVVITLVAEPLVRLSLGLVLAAIAGERGAATGIALGGWAALAIAAPESLGPRLGRSARRALRLPLEESASVAIARERTQASALPPSPVLGPTRWTALTFLLLAIVMSQDLLWANRLLPGQEAAIFAVLSTLGGAAAFATSTIPLVLLGDDERPGAFRTALVWATGLGAAALLVVAAAPRLLTTIAFGQRYADVATLALRYVLAMALLGFARVLAARLCSSGAARTSALAVGGVALIQASVIVASSRTADSVATATLIATALLTLILGFLVILRLPPQAVPIVPGDSVDEHRRARRLARTYRRVLEATRAQGVDWLKGAATRAVARTIDTLRAGAGLAIGGPRLARRALQDLPAYLAMARRWTSEISKDRTVRVVAMLTLAALALRVAATRSVWLDEAIAVSQARLGLRDMLESLRYGDVHPPLHSAVLWVTVRVFGTSELAVRLPSIVAGALLIPVLYALGRELYGKRTGLIAAGFATIAPFLVWYSQEARMYSLFMLFGLSAILAQLRIVKRGGRLAWTVYVIATVLMLWTHYFAILQVLVQQGFFAATAWRRRHGSGRPFVRSWATASLFLILLMIPLVPILRDQLVAYGNRGTSFGDVPARAGGTLDPGQQQLSIYALLANLVWAMWGYHSDATMAKLVALWPLGMLFMLFLLGRRHAWVSVLAVAALVGPMIGLFAIGFVKRDLFELRYFAVTAPLLILLMARVITAGFKRGALRVAAIVIVGASLLGGAIDQQTNGANPRIYDFRGALSAVSDIARPTDTVVYAPNYLEPVITYYAPHLRAQTLNPDRQQAAGGRVILLASFLDKKDISGRVGGALGKLRENHRLVRELELPRVKVWVFS